MRTQCLVCVVGIMLLAAAPARPQTVNAPRRSVIGTGDLLEITVFDTPELSTKARVNDAGEIAYPFMGRVAVQGLAPEDAAQAIRRKLIELAIVRDPQVSVFVAEAANQFITVLGEVKKPGTYPAFGARHLLDLISAAEGPTPTAGDAITITARDQSSPPTVVSLSSGQNPEVFSGDTIQVARAGMIYVVGEVGRPGAFVLDRGEHMTVLQALALAQGTKPNAKLNSVKIIRRGTDGQRQEIPIQLKKVVSGAAEDFALNDDDVLFVPDNRSKNAAKRGIEAVLQVATGLAIYRR